ncbi:MAG TPA: NAD-dependent epimerase/dehydratase family protein [Gemmatimonadota bacterium]|nr:NAD-dependent epimerase/dehydratase family protein [Gemmatimonadota bacterium]
MPRTALVTGATGFVGSHVVDVLLEAGWRVRCTVRATSDLRWMEGKDAELLVADLADDVGLKRAVAGVDAVIHCAGRTRGSRQQLFAANHEGTRQLLEACAGSGRQVRFVYCSSLAAAGPGTLERPREEDDAPAPNSDYGRSKLAGEEETLKYAGRFDVAILRPGSVYGPRDEDTLPFFQMAAKGVVVVPGFRRRLVQLVHARDVAAALRLAAEKPAAVGRTYFVAHPEILDWKELAAAIAGAVNRRTLSLRLPSPVMRIAGLASELVGSGAQGQLDRRRAADMSERAWTCRVDRLMGELGWEPAYDSQRGLRETAEWYRKEGWM